MRQVRCWLSSTFCAHNRSKLSRCTLATAVATASTVWLLALAGTLMLFEHSQQPPPAHTRLMLRGSLDHNPSSMLPGDSVQPSSIKFDESRARIALIASTPQHLNQWQGPSVQHVCVTAAISDAALAWAQDVVSALADASVHRLRPGVVARVLSETPPHPLLCARALAQDDAIQPGQLLVIVQGGVLLSPQALRWVAAALPADGQRGVLLGLASAGGVPLESTAAPACFDATGRRVGKALCTPPLDALLIHSCHAAPEALAASAEMWHDLLHSVPFNAISDVNVALTAACERSNWRVAHLNLGATITLAAPASSNTAQLLKHWRPELDLAASTPTEDVAFTVGVVGDDKPRMYAPSHSGTASLVRAMRHVMRAQQVLFAGLIIANAAFVEMTRHWLCQVRGMPGVLRRTVVLCTDAACLDELRNDPIASRLGGVMGMDIDARLQALRQELGTLPSNTGLASDLNWGTQAYHLFMLTRQLVLKDLVDSDVPYLLFETDAWWQRNAYAYLDRVLASGGELRSQLHASPPSGMSQQYIKDAPFDMALYVDVPHPVEAGTIGVGGGFFLALPLPGTKRLFEKWASNVRDGILSSLHQVGVPVNETEQAMLQRLVTQRYSGFRPLLLPIDLFPNGQFYQGLTDAAQAAKKVQAHEAIVIQFNYVVGTRQKVRRAKRYHHWGLADNGKCLSLSVLPL